MGMKKTGAMQRSHFLLLLPLKMTMVILCCCLFEVQARRIINTRTTTLGCYAPYLSLRNTLHPTLSARVTARKTKDNKSNVASEKLPECFFNVVRGYVADFTKSTELAANVTDEKIISLIMGEMKIASPLLSSFSSLPLEQTENSNEQEVHSSGLAMSVPKADPNYRRYLLGDQAACYDSTINMIVESVSLLMTLVGLGGVGRAVGRSVAKKLKKDGLNEAKDIGQRLGSSASTEETAQAATDLILLTFTEIGFNSIMKSIEDNVEWHEWLLLVVSITAQIAALVATGGTALFLQLLSLGIALTTFGIAAAAVARDCEDIDEIGCLSHSGFTFYEGLNSDGGNFFGWDDDTSFETIANECRSESFCQGFNTLRWRKSLIFPYDEWVPIPGSCAGVFIKEGVEICTNQLDGFKFYPLFDSPGNTISSQPYMSLEDLAEICRSEGDDCQGFNTEGDKKSIINSIPTWTRPENLCQGLFVKKGIDICPSVPGYTFYSDFISEGSVLVDLDVNDGFIDVFVEECNDRGSACVGFTTFGSLKSDIAPHRDWTPSGYTCYGTYVKTDVLVDIPVDCNDLDGYEYYPNKDSSGNDIGRIEGASKSELAQACNDDPSCEGFNTNFDLKHQIKPPNQMDSPDGVQGICQGLYVKQGILYPPDAYCQSGGRVEIDVSRYRRFNCFGSYPGEMKFIWRTLATTDYGFDDDAYYIRVMKDGSAGEEVYNSGRKTLNQGSGSGSIVTEAGDRFVVEFDCDNDFFRCEGGDFEFKLVSCDCYDGADPILNCDISSVSRARDAICPARTQAPTTLSPSISPDTILCPNKYVRIKEVCAIPEFESDDGNVEIKIEMDGMISWPKYEGCPGSMWSGACELPNEAVVGCYELAGSEQRLFTEAQSISVRVIDEDTFGEDDWHFEIPATWYDMFDCSNSEFEIPHYNPFSYPDFKIIVDVKLIPDPTQIPTQPPNDDSSFPEDETDIRCFSEDVTVHVRDKGSIPIKSLRVGDYVLTGNAKEIYQPVYAFALRDEVNFAEFLRITMVEINDNANINEGFPKRNHLELTGHHLIYAQNKGGRPIRADSLTLGDILYGTNETCIDGNTFTMHHSVVKIQKVLRRGYYAPLTPHGSIIVNGFLASTYAGVSSKSSNEYVQINGIDLPLLQADGVHMALSPLRLVYRGNAFFSSILNNSNKKEKNAYINNSSYNKGNGSVKQPYVSICLRLVLWVEEQHMLVQVIIFCVALLIFGFSTLMEEAAVNTTCSVIIILLFACAITLIFPRKQVKKN